MEEGKGANIATPSHMPRFAAESSTILLNTRLMMIQLGRGTGPAFDFVQGSFFLSFIFVRVAVCCLVLTPMWYGEVSTLLSAPGGPGEGEAGFQVWMLTFTFVVMNCLNWTWSYQMIKMAVGGGKGAKKEREPKDRGEKKLTPVNFWFVLLVKLIPSKTTKGKEL